MRINPISNTSFGTNLNNELQEDIKTAARSGLLTPEHVEVIENLLNDGINARLGLYKQGDEFVLDIESDNNFRAHQIMSGYIFDPKMKKVPQSLLQMDDGTKFKIEDLIISKFKVGQKESYLRKLMLQFTPNLIAKIAKSEARAQTIIDRYEDFNLHPTKYELDEDADPQERIITKLNELFG